MSRMLVGGVVAAALPWVPLAAEVRAERIAGPTVSASLAASDGDGDCNEQDPWIFPGGEEACNGWDDDCDGLKDEGCQAWCVNPELRFGDRRVDGSDGVDQRQPAMAVANHGYGITWNQPIGTSGCAEIRFVRVDEGGMPLAGPAVLRAPGSAGRASRESAVAWTGREFLVAWAEEPVADCTTAGYEQLYVQRVDAHGAAGDEPALLTCRNGRAGAPAIVFTGRFAVVAWVEALNFPSSLDGVYLARVGTDGQVLDPCGVMVSGPPDADLPKLAWSGTELGLAWRAHPVGAPQFDSEIHFERFSQDLVPLDPEPRRITNDDGPSDFVSLVWADGAWGLAWRQDFVFGYAEIAFARLDASGRLMPPGIVQVTHGAELPGGSPKALPDLEWTGAEYGLTYVLRNNRTTAEGDVLFARVSRDGVHLEPDAVMTTDRARKALFPATAWNGIDYGVAWQDSSSGAVEVRFGRIGCGCSDADGDGFDSCATADCDDTRADVNPLGVELCGNGADDDCNGLTDCRDPACAVDGVPPAEVAQLHAGADKDSWSWDPAAGADRYDAARGRLEDLRDLEGPRAASCVGADLTEPRLRDPTAPPPGAGLYYLVRAEAGPEAACRVSPWGSGSDEVVAACP